MGTLTEEQMMPVAMVVKQPFKLPSKKVLSRSCNGIAKRLRKETDPGKRYRLKAMKEEMEWLIEQL